MRFTLRCVQCMATSVLRDQQYRYAVRSLLAAEKALLIRNDLAGMLLMARVNFRHCSAYRYFTSFSAQNRPQSSQVSEGVCSMDAKTTKSRTAGHANDDISWQPAALQHRRGGDAGEDCNGWWDLGSSLSTGDKAQASRQWKHKESPTPTKFNVVPSASKVMSTVFWDMRGVLLVEFQCVIILQSAGATQNCNTNKT